MSTAARFYNAGTGVTIAGFIDDDWLLGLTDCFKVTKSITKEVVYLPTSDWEMICYARISEDNHKVVLDKS